MTAGLRRGSRQIPQRSCSDTLPQISQKRTFSRTSASSCARRDTSKDGDLQDVERDALRRLRADAGKAAELVDQILDDAVVHGLAEPRRRLVRLFAHEARAEHLAHDGFAVALRAAGAGRVAALGSGGATTGGTGASVAASAVDSSSSSGSIDGSTSAAGSTSPSRGGASVATRDRAASAASSGSSSTANCATASRRLGIVRRRRVGIAGDRRDHPFGDGCGGGRPGGSGGRGRARRRFGRGPADGGASARCGGRGGAGLAVVLGEVLHPDAEHGEDRLAQVFARTGAGRELLELRDVGLALERQGQHVARRARRRGAGCEQPRRAAGGLEPGEHLGPGVAHVLQGDRARRGGRGSTAGDGGRGAAAGRASARTAHVARMTSGSGVRGAGCGARAGCGRRRGGAGAARHRPRRDGSSVGGAATAADAAGAAPDAGTRSARAPARP